MVAKTTTTQLAIIVLAMCGTAIADEVRVGKLVYHDVAVLGGTDGQVVFRGPMGNRIALPSADVTLIVVDGRPAFGKAEKLASQGKDAAAVESYADALPGATGPMARLVRYRLLAALDRQGAIARATKLWLELLAESPDSTGTIELRPGRLAPTGAKRNAEAISLLEAARVRAGNDSQRGAIDGLLLKLYRIEGRRGTVGVATRMARRSEMARRSDGQIQPDRPAAAAVGVADRLNALAVLLGHGDAKAVAAELAAGLRAGRYRGDIRGRALLLSARAQRKLASLAEGPEKRRLLIGAGLDFMRVATFFPSAPEAPGALFAAGRVNADLGNIPAAMNAYRAVIKTYPASGASKDAAVAIRHIRSDKTVRQPSSMDKPAADKPAVDKPAADKPAVDKLAADNPAVDNPSVGKAGPRTTKEK